MIFPHFYHCSQFLQIYLEYAAFIDTFKNKLIQWRLVECGIICCFFNGFRINFFSEQGIRLSSVAWNKTVVRGGKSAYFATARLPPSDSVVF